jgi:hypothetical protein
MVLAFSMAKYFQELRQKTFTMIHRGKKDHVRVEFKKRKPEIMSIIKADIISTT